jgi:hypothetical protein
MQEAVEKKEKDEGSNVEGKERRVEKKEEIL